jgi:ribosomal protein L7Ae-like RNA K-turn-binding protein
MNTENISKAMMLVFDELKNDKASESLIRKIDEATDDEEIKEGLREGTKRLRELGKIALAEDIEQKTKGFAF